MRFARLAATLGLLLFAGAAYAQSAYLPAGENATLIGASWFGSDEFDGYGAEFAYEMAGSLAFGARFDRLSRTGDPGVDWDDFEETSVAPFLSALVFRPVDGFPVGVDSRVAYSFTTFEGENVDAIDQEARGSVLSLDLRLLARLSPFENLKIWPRLTGSWYASSVSAQLAALDIDENEEIDELERFDSDDLPQYSWAAGLGVQLAERLVLALDRVEYEHEEPVFRLAFLAFYPHRDEWWQ